MTNTFNFSANGHDFGNYEGETQQEAKEAFAQDAGYRSWAAMVEQTKDFGGDIEVAEVFA